MPTSTIHIQTVHIDVLLSPRSTARSVLDFFLLAKERPDGRQADHDDACSSFYELPEEYPYRIRGVVREGRVRDADDGNDDHEDGKT